MTDAQELTLRRLCARYKVDFREYHYAPQFDLPADYVAGWIGGNDGRRPLYVGVDGEGNASS